MSIPTSLIAATPAEGLRIAGMLARAVADGGHRDMADCLSSRCPDMTATTAHFFSAVAAANGYWTAR